MKEVWKDIFGYEGLYQISNTGRVKSFAWNKTKILKPGVDKDGYFRVILVKNKKRKDFCVHRLVAQMFVKNPQNKKQVNHKDGNKQNNQAKNLEWCTPQENVLHAIHILKKRTKKVDKYSLKGIYIETYESIEDAGLKNNIKSQHIWRCCNNIRPTTGGFIWKYNNPTNKEGF